MPFLLIAAVLLGLPLAAFGLRAVLRLPRHRYGLPLAPEVHRGRPIGRLHGLYWQLMNWTGMAAPLHQQIAAVGQIRPDERVLDLGAGTGELTLLLKTRVGDRGLAAGLDITLPSLRRSLRRARNFDVPARFVGGDAVHLPFAPGSFDAITCSLMAHHLPDPAKRAMFAEIHRVLRPGGRLVFFDLTRPVTASEWWRVWAILSLDLLFEWDRAFANLRGALPEMIRDAGFVMDGEQLWPLRGVRAHFIIGRKA